MPIDTDFIDSFVLDYLRRRASEDDFHTYQVGEYYPHMLGYCPLKAWFEYKLGPHITDRGVQFVNLGYVLHDLVLSAYREMGYQVEVPFEYRVNRDIVVRGRADAVGLGHVIEVKTVSQLRRASLPYPNHVAQLNFYLGVFRYNRGLLHYIDRRDLSRFYHEVEFSRDLFDSSIQRVIFIHEHLVDDVPPPPEPVAQWECRDCPYRRYCPLHGGSIDLFLRRSIELLRREGSSRSGSGD